MREVEEELGVVGVPLEPLGVADYADEHTSYRAGRFVVTWDGPIRWQPEEVSWGEWVTVEELVRRLDAGGRHHRARQRRRVVGDAAVVARGA